MPSWGSSYRAEGEVAVSIGGRLYPVVLPDLLSVNLFENPGREPPNPQMTLLTFGRTEGERSRPGPIAAGSARIGSELLRRPPPPEVCGGVGWAFDLDSVDEPRLFRINVTVPVGVRNATWGLILDRHLPWDLGHAGTPEGTTAISGVYTYRVAASGISPGHRRWTAEAVDTPAPWLNRFELDLTTEPDGLGQPPRDIQVRYDSEADEGCLQASLSATKA